VNKGTGLAHQGGLGTVVQVLPHFWDALHALHEAHERRALGKRVRLHRERVVQDVEQSEVCVGGRSTSEVRLLTEYILSHNESLGEFREVLRVRLEVGGAAQIEPVKNGVNIHHFQRHLLHHVVRSGDFGIAGIGVGQSGSIPGE
jgi:hypothetical protein